MNIDRWLNYSHGLELLPNINKGRRHNENGILFFVEYLVLKKHLNLLTPKDKEDFITVVDNLRTKNKNKEIVPGLFDRGQGESYEPIEPVVRMISHDNLTAISVGSKMFGLKHHNDIAKYGLSHGFMFDNGSPDKPRLIYHKANGQKDTSWKMHPRDWFYWLFNSNNVLMKTLGMVFFPIFFISQVIACFTGKPNTSGKMLLWLRLLDRKELPLKITWIVCNYILSKKYSKNWISDISKIYFHQTEENPIRVLARKL